MPAEKYNLSSFPRWYYELSLIGALQKILTPPLYSDLLVNGTGEHSYWLNYCLEIDVIYNKG
jgi:hypothetical protein